jgi:hypothetical protein
VPPPAQCDQRGLTDWTAWGVWHQLAAVRFLTAERGYEVEAASDTGILERLGLTVSDLHEIVATLRNCAADRSQWTPTPSNVREAAMGLGRRIEADAVLLVERAEVCLKSESKFRSTIAALLGGNPGWSASDDPRQPYTAYVRAAMFETGSGSLVWYRELTTGALWAMARQTGSHDLPYSDGITGLPWSTISREMKWLLEGIEPAIPQALTR